MKRTLYIIRHAEAEDQQSGQNDFSRMLTPKGINQCLHTTDKLNAKFISIDKLISSDAMRTSQTAKLLARFLYIDEAKLSFDNNIYQASANMLLNLISNLSNEWHSVMIVGHNPGVSALVQHLTNCSNSFSTCSVACIEFDSLSWSRISTTKGKLTFFISPEEAEEEEE